MRPYNKLEKIYENVDQLIQHRANAVRNGARDRARRKGIPYELEITDVYDALITSDVCPILGVEMTWHDGLNYDPYARTLDRINPELGYVPDNIWIILMRANQIKSDASLPELITAMANLVNHLYKDQVNERTGTGYRDRSEAQYDLDLCN